MQTLADICMVSSIFIMDNLFWLSFGLASITWLLIGVKIMSKASARKHVRGLLRAIWE